MRFHQLFTLLLMMLIWQLSHAEQDFNTSSFTVAKTSRPQVDIYYAAWDPHSNKALKFFQDHHIVVNAYDIELDAEAAMRKKKLAPDFIGIPLVIINGIVIRGVDEQKYQDALHPIKPPR